MTRRHRSLQRNERTKVPLSVRDSGVKLMSGLDSGNRSLAEIPQSNATQKLGYLKRSHPMLAHLAQSKYQREIV